jgi:hypothetical protein
LPAGGYASSTAFSTTESTPTGAFVDNGFVYWATDAFAIRRAPIASTPTPTDVVPTGALTIRIFGVRDWR